MRTNEEKEYLAESGVRSAPLASPFGRVARAANHNSHDCRWQSYQNVLGAPVGGGEGPLSHGQGRDSSPKGGAKRSLKNALAADADAFPHGSNGALFQPGYLSLGDSQKPCHLHLGFAVIEPQGQNLLFPGAEAAEGVLQGDVLHPALFGVLGVPDLIHDGERVAAIGIDGVKEAHGGADRIQCLIHIFNGNIQKLGNFLHGGVPVHLGGELLLALQNPVGHIPDGPGDTDWAVVSQITANLPSDHGNDMQKAKFY